MTDNNSNTSTNKLTALCSEVFDLDAIPSAEDAHVENLANGIDTSNLKKWATEQQIQTKAKAALVRAREQRIHKESIVKTVASNTPRKIEELKEWLINRLNGLSPSQRAQIYARDFENASEKDLLEMEQDLLSLERLSEKNSHDES